MCSQSCGFSLHDHENFGWTTRTRDVLETFDRVQTFNFRFAIMLILVRFGQYIAYRFAHISRTLKALQISTKMSLRINDEGLLSLQFLMPSPSPKLGKRDESPAAFIRQLSCQCLALDD